MNTTFPGRVGLQQRVIPSYRADFIETLSAVCQGGLSVFAGEPLAIEGINPVKKLNIARYTLARNHYLRSPDSPLFLCWQGGFIDWLRDWQPDILIVEANPRYIATRLAVSWMHRHGHKVIGWGLGAPPLAGPMAGFRRWERVCFIRSLDALVAYSQVGARQYSQLGMLPGSVFVAPNAVAHAPSSSPPTRPDQSGGKVNILFVGRLQERKRVDLLLRACSALPKGLQPKLMVVGDGPARTDLEDLARQVYPSAEFVGAKHGDELESYFVQADLFVLPGTGGLAIQQAMAHGLPVVVARGDGTQDDLVRSENGWQIPADDLEVLTATLQEALSDPIRLRRMGSASYRIVVEEINVDKMVDTFVQVLNSVISTAQAPSDKN